MVGILAAVVVLAGAAVYFFIPRANPKAKPLIDPVVSAHFKTEQQKTDRAYAQFQKEFTPESVTKLQQNLLEAAARLQAQQDQTASSK